MRFTSAYQADRWLAESGAMKAIYILDDASIWIGDRDDARSPVRRELSRSELSHLAENEHDVTNPAMEALRLIREKCDTTEMAAEVYSELAKAVVFYVSNGSPPDEAARFALEEVA